MCKRYSNIALIRTQGSYNSVASYPTSISLPSIRATQGIPGNGLVAALGPRARLNHGLPGASKARARGPRVGKWKWDNDKTGLINPTPHGRSTRSTRNEITTHEVHSP